MAGAHSINNKNYYSDIVKEGDLTNLWQNGTGRFAWVVAVFVRKNIRLPDSLIREFSQLSPEFYEKRLYVAQHARGALYGGVRKDRAIFYWDNSDAEFIAACRSLLLLLRREIVEDLINNDKSEAGWQIELYSRLYESLTYCDKVACAWQAPLKSSTDQKPDLVVGFRKNSRVFKFHQSEAVHLGVIAAQHSKDPATFRQRRDALFQDMRYLCIKQKEAGVAQPLAFGILWRAELFNLYAMEISRDFRGGNDIFIPYLLCDMNGYDAMDLVRIFEVIWWLRCHVQHTAEILNTHVWTKAVNFYSVPRNVVSAFPPKSLQNILPDIPI